jgi:transcriptional regulator with XRE-family HTH domain
MRIKEMRDERRLTQHELAEKAGVSKASIVNWEGCKRTPSIEDLESIAKALQTNTLFLLGESDEADIQNKNIVRNKSESALMFERLMAKMAERSPDLVVHFRDLDKHIDELAPEDIQGLADGYAILTGMATKAVMERMKTKSRHGDV